MEAKEHYNKCLDTTVLTLGRGHPETAHTLYNLGLLEQGMGNTEAAQKAWVEALGVWMGKLGQNHPSTVDVQRTLDQLPAAAVLVCEKKDSGTPGKQTSTE